MSKRVLITGGTSGLGQALALMCRDNGYEVMVTGRNVDKIPKDITSFKVDFADIKSVTRCARKIQGAAGHLDFLVNCTGILAPATYQVTTDGFEQTYQVNFLSHVLLTTLLKNAGVLKRTKVVNVSSPLFKYGKIDQFGFSPKQYSSWKAYCNTKLFMFLFSKKIQEDKLDGFCFNPGTFSSGIYRGQNQWFRSLYKAASPFMKSSDLVASGLFKLFEKDAGYNGNMVDRLGKIQEIASPGPQVLNRFWQQVDQELKQSLGYADHID